MNYYLKTNSCDRFRRTGVARPLSSMPGRSNKRKPPRGLVVNHDDLAELAGQPNQANNTLQAIDTEIVSLKRQVRYTNSILLGRTSRNVWIHFFYTSYPVHHQTYIKILLPSNDPLCLLLIVKFF